MKYTNYQVETQGKKKTTYRKQPLENNLQKATTETQNYYQIST